jgi:alpha-beta hydrolase superfamily lysophospholipase
VAAIDLPAAWSRVSVPVLLLQGGSDYVTSLDEHEAIARVVNRIHPGLATLEPLPGVDHQLSRAESMEASRARGPAPGEFNPLVLDRILAWLRPLAAAR